MASALGIATVVAALAILCAAVIYYPCFRAAQARLSRARVEHLHQQLASYVREHRACPAPTELRHAAHRLPPRAFNDAWGTKLTYVCSDVELRVRSAGPDELFDTADDITYPVSAARSGVR